MGMARVRTKAAKARSKKTSKKGARRSATRSNSASSKRSRSSKPKRRKQVQKRIELGDDIISQLKTKKAWALIALAFGLALIFQQFNLVTLAVDEDVLPACSKHDHCAVGKFCTFGKCYAHTPDYPEIGKVKVFTNGGVEVLPDMQGYYRVPAQRLMYLEVQADNEREPFNIEVYTPLGFGQKGLEKNQDLYFSPLAPGERDHKNLYWVRVDDQERDFRHRFYFELIGFQEEKFNMFVYLKNVSDVSEDVSEFVELPIKII